MVIAFILTAGLGIVIGGIVALRLHAFVALILAALFVAVCTPPHLVVRSQMPGTAVTITASEEAPEVLLIDSDTLNPQLVSLSEGVKWVLIPESPGDKLDLRQTGVFEERMINGSMRQVLLPADRSVWLQNSAAQPPAGESSTFSIRIAELSRATMAEKLSQQSGIQRVSDAFGQSCSKLAILIATASIIGTALLKSGAADRIVRTTLHVSGERGAPFALAISSFILAIPVFFDTVFLLMLPLAVALFRQTQRNYLLFVLAIVCGGTMAHSLVPPTPGPLMIAEAFNVPMPEMVIGGTITGLVGSAAALGLAWRFNQRITISPPADLRLAEPESGARPLPGIAESLIPVVLPLILMTMDTAFDEKSRMWTLGSFALPRTISESLHSICDKNIAVLVGAFAAVATWLRFPQGSKSEFSEGIQSAIASAGGIILVTAAGGAFGTVLQQTSVADYLRTLPATTPLSVLLISFLVTAAIRTAQGSATVAMMTSAGIFGGLVNSGVLGISPLWVALAVGCGSKPFPWMNDSGFLVITRMSGMTESQGLRYLSPVMSLAGIAALGAVILGALLLG